VPTEPTTSTANSIEELVAAARAARDRSYAPYSDFRMGAAVRGDDGSIVPGVLIENVSLGLAMCAERVALFGAVARGIGPVALVLSSERTSGELTFPCGACLQVAIELAGPEMIVTAADLDGRPPRAGPSTAHLPNRGTCRRTLTPIAVRAPSPGAWGWRRRIPGNCCT
jgi:cytidine deaminase